MRRTHIVLILVVLILTACASQSSASPTPVTNDDRWVQTETFAVYEALIRSEYGSTTVVVRPTNMQSRVTEGSDPDLQTSTARTFNRLNQEISAIEDHFDEDLTVTFLGKSEFEAFFPEDGDRDEQWDAFYSEYEGSGGYLQLSLVAFSDDGSQALVRYIAQGRSEIIFCTDRVLLFENQDGEWEMTDTLDETAC